MQLICTLRKSDLERRLEEQRDVLVPPEMKSRLHLENARRIEECIRIMRESMPYAVANAFPGLGMIVVLVPDDRSDDASRTILEACGEIEEVVPDNEVDP